MNSSSPALGALSTLAKIAETDRQIREIGGLIERTLGTVQKFWPAIALFAAGWVYMVSDEQRLAVLEAIGDEAYKVLPLEEVGNWLTAG